MALTAVDIALSNMTALKNQLDMTANNMANANTQGYNRLFMPMSSEPRQSKYSEKISFVQDIAALKDTSLGSITQSNNPYHVYLNGAGYFAVQTANGVRYTRAGTFMLDSQSQLINQEGYLVLDEGLGPITFPEGEVAITISDDGTISSKNGVIARLGHFRFENPFNITNEEGTLINTTQQPEEATGSSVIQHAYEGSNVNTIIESTKLVYISQAFHQMQRLVEEQNKLTSEIIDSVGRSMSA